MKYEYKGTSNLSAEWYEGFKSVYINETIEPINPYKKGTVSHEEWEKGYSDAIECLYPSDNQ